MFGCHGKYYFLENDFQLTNFFTFDPEISYSPHFHFKCLPEKEREREREEKAQIREREREERATIAPARSTIDDRRSTRSRGAIVDLPARSTRSRGAIDEIARRDRRARSSDAHRSSDERARRTRTARRHDHRSTVRSKNRLHFFCWVLVFLPDLMHFL